MPLYLAATVEPTHLSEGLYWNRILGWVTESNQRAAGRAKRSVLIIGQFSHSVTGRCLPASELSIPERSGLGLCQQAHPSAACSGAAGGTPTGVFGPRPGIAWGRLLRVSTPGLMSC